jgi:hypothetical protein
MVRLHLKDHNKKLSSSYKVSQWKWSLVKVQYLNMHLFLLIATDQILSRNWFVYRIFYEDDILPFFIGSRIFAERAAFQGVFYINPNFTKSFYNTVLSLSHEKIPNKS